MPSSKPIPVTAESEPEGSAYTRSRGDYRSDNHRLQDVARSAARMLQVYSYEADGQRVFTLEPLPHPPSVSATFRDLDLQNEWRALWEALIVAGVIEPDHAALPAETGSTAFIRVQLGTAIAAKGGKPATTSWATVAQFEVLPGAGTYALADTRALETFYSNRRKKTVRLVRDALPTSSRAQYLMGQRDRAQSAVIGMLNVQEVPQLAAGFFAIFESSAAPETELDSSGFWPARIVLGGRNGERGPQGPRGPQGEQGPRGRDGSGDGSAHAPTEEPEPTADEDGRDSFDGGGVGNWSESGGSNE